MPVRIEDLPLSKAKQCRDALDRGLTAFTLTVPAGEKLEPGPVVIRRGKAYGLKRGQFKQGWRTIGGQRCWFRSAWEANLARYLQLLKSHREIIGWKHEPKRFDFPIKRGNNSYLPDFRVVKKDHLVEWWECKGYMTAGGRTKMKRFLKFYPDEKLVLIDKDAYQALAKQCRNLIPSWE
jgi:hypothetical protein